MKFLIFSLFSAFNLFASKPLCIETTERILVKNASVAHSLGDLDDGIHTITFYAKSINSSRQGLSFIVESEGLHLVRTQEYSIDDNWTRISYTFYKRTGTRNDKLIISSKDVSLRSIKIKKPFFFSEEMKSTLGISYSGYRNGQVPGVNIPSTKQILEDLNLLVKHGFDYVRMYGSDAYAEKTLKIIREHKVPVKMVLGAWVEPETTRHGMDDNIFDLGEKIPELVQKNNEEIDRNIRLANEYRDEVIAINVGNEVLTFWSTHKVPYDSVVNYVQRVKKETGLPVSVAENHSFWLSDESNWLASEVDFIMLHTYPQWENVSIDSAFGQTIDQYYATKYKHNMIVMIGEDGWTTSNNGNPQIIHHEANEENQAIYYNQIMPWAYGEDIRITYFEFSDEPWKGGGNLSEPETNWGIFREDRTPKKAIKKN